MIRIKTNVFFNGPHLGEELEEWLNEPHDGCLVNVILTERPSEPERVIARAVFDESKFVSLRDFQKSQSDAKHAHQEVGALVSIVLEVHRHVATISEDVQNVALIKKALEKCIEEPSPGVTVVNLTKLLPPQG